MQSEVYAGEDQLICMCLGLSFQQLGHDHYNDISLAEGPDNNAAVLCEVIHRYWQLFSDWNPKIKHNQTQLTSHEISPRAAIFECYTHSQITCFTIKLLLTGQPARQKNGTWNLWVQKPYVPTMGILCPHAASWALSHSDSSPEPDSRGMWELKWQGVCRTQSHIRSSSDVSHMPACNRPILLQLLRGKEMCASKPTDTCDT